MPSLGGLHRTEAPSLISAPARRQLAISLKGRDAPHAATAPCWPLAGSRRPRPAACPGARSKGRGSRDRPPGPRRSRVLLWEPKHAGPQPCSHHAPPTDTTSRPDLGQEPGPQLLRSGASRPRLLPQTWGKHQASGPPAPTPGTPFQGDSPGSGPPLRTPSAPVQYNPPKEGGCPLKRSNRQTAGTRASRTPSHVQHRARGAGQGQEGALPASRGSGPPGCHQPPPKQHTQSHICTAPGAPWCPPVPAPPALPGGARKGARPQLTGCRARARMAPRCPHPQSRTAPLPTGT